METKKLVLYTLIGLWLVAFIGFVTTYGGGYQPNLNEKDYPIERGDGLRCQEIWEGDKLIERNCRSERNFAEASSTFSEDNFIQAAHNDFTYSINSGLKVPEVDYCKVITGDSMQPTIFEGNVVCIKKYHHSMKNTLSEGMIIEYSNEHSSSVIHRIKSVYSSHIQAQGDNDNYNEKIEYEQIK